MIALERNILSFNFPEIEQLLALLVGRHIRNVLSSYVLPANREELVDELGSMRPFWNLPSTAQENLLRKAHSLTDSKIEAFLRKAALVAAGLNGHSPAQLIVQFQRPPRIPNDAKVYVFRGGLEQVSLRPAKDFAETIPTSWLKQPAFLIPIDARDAFSIRFSSRYPFAVKVSVGKLDALTGESSLSDLQREPRNYLVVSGESTVNGIKERSVVLPVNARCGASEHFSEDRATRRIQLQICPLRVESYFREEIAHSIPPTLREFFAWFVYGPSLHARWAEIQRVERQGYPELSNNQLGTFWFRGQFDDEFDGEYLRELTDWDQSQTKCCVIHSCDLSIWRQITGANPPQPRLSDE
jgi:hypothetical protein